MVVRRLPDPVRDGSTATSANLTNEGWADKLANEELIPAFGAAAKHFGLDKLDVHSFRLDAVTTTAYLESEHGPICLWQHNMWAGLYRGEGFGIEDAGDLFIDDDDRAYTHIFFPREASGVRRA